MIKKTFGRFIALILCGSLLFAGSAAAEETSGDAGQPNILKKVESLSHDGYTLDQMVVFSRHNIRSPLSKSGSLLDIVTPYEWFKWTSNPSELSLRGGLLETDMGEYFRRWLESEGLFPENYMPEEGEVRFYANARQRTIATANFFKAGLLPIANVEVETHAELGEVDPTFKTRLTFCTDEYAEDARAQAEEMYGEEIRALAPSYQLLSEVIGLKDSTGYKDGTITDLVTDDTVVTMEDLKEPTIQGSLNTAYSVSDSLILQYYEEPDPVKAAFGTELTEDQWIEFGHIKDVYNDVIFTTPLIAVNIAHPMLEEIESELNREGRKFTFLCGHDSNIASILGALGVTGYIIPDVIEQRTPIGSKIVFTEWTDEKGDAYMSVDLVCAAPWQLRERDILDLDNPPVIAQVELPGIARNEDGLYARQDVMDCLEKAIAEYDSLVEKYLGNETVIEEFVTEEEQLDQAA